ncbi:MAG: DUF3833 domain-containing protein [Proteobacteria bacterium]|nr:DUF3833 domain-containing protein [Burkholderiales bacterium]
MISMIVALALAGCASVDPEVYSRETPVLDLARYFNGTLVGHGMFKGRSGKVERRFVVTIDAQWKGNVGTLDERFEWSDGEKQRRVWTITKIDDNTYTGTADDVVGVAQGKAYGNALNWTYTLALPVSGRTWHVQFDDWMYLIDERVMLNTAVISKWGVQVGQLTLSFARK